MRIERQLKLQGMGISALNSIFSHAQHFGLTSKRMEEDKHKALDAIGVRKAPQWVGRFLDGYWRCICDRMYAHGGDLVYGAYLGDTFYSTHSDRADYYEKHGMDARSFCERHTAAKTGGHYWKTTLKPFYTNGE